MYRILLNTVIAILFSANTVTIAQSANGDWISISGNSNFDILADTDIVIVRVPVKLKSEVNQEQVNLKLFDISLGNRHEMRLINAVKLLPFNYTNNELSPAILLQVDLRQIKIQGTYNLQFHAMTKGLPDAVLNLTINIPAATLRQEGPVIIDYPTVLRTTYYRIFRKGSSKSYNEATMNLQEISGKSRLTEIQIYSLGFSDANNRKIEGNLEFSEVPTLINPHSSFSAKYKFAGKFPLGTVNGKVEISAPQLALPILVEFKIHRRLTPLLIILITLVGLGLGFISRTLLQSKISNAENRIKVLDLMDQINQLIAKHEDKNFRDKLKGYKDALTESLKIKDVEKIREAVTSTEQMVKTALEKLHEERSKIEILFKDFTELVQTSWSVPVGVEKALNDTKNELTFVEAFIDKDNIGDANSMLNELHNKLLKDLRNSVTEWSDNMSANLQVLSKESKLPMTVTEKMCQPISQLNAVLDQIRIAPNATITEIKGNLSAIDTTRSNIQKVKKLLINWLHNSLSDVEQVYGVARLEEKPLEELSTGLKKIFNEFEDENNLEQAIEFLIHRDIPEMIRLWQSFFVPQINKTPPAEQNNLMALLNKYDYLEVAHKTISIQYTKKEAVLGFKKEMLPEEAELPKTEMIEPIFQMLTGQQQSSKVVLMKSYRQYEMLQNTQLNRYLTVKELAKLKWLQSLIVGAGIALVGYMLYEPNFVGTMKEIMQIFFWAFGLDVTFNTLIDQAKSVKKTGA